MYICTYIQDGLHRLCMRWGPKWHTAQVRAGTPLTALSMHIGELLGGARFAPRQERERRRALELETFGWLACRSVICSTRLVRGD